jgi:hypothetical protein
VTLQQQSGRNIRDCAGGRHLARVVVTRLRRAYSDGTPVDRYLLRTYQPRQGMTHGPQEGQWGATILSARKHAIIKDMQAAIAREMAAQSEVPKSMPTRIAELVRELNRRLRDADQGARRSKGETGGEKVPRIRADKPRTR